MVDNSLGVSGGVGGITAHYDDMLNYAAGLDAVVAALTDRLPEVSAVAGNSDLLASAVLSPGTAARVEELVVAATVGPRGLGAAAVRMKATALSLRSAVDAYRAVDAAQAQLISTFHEVAAVPFLIGAVDKAEFDTLTHPVTSWKDFQDLPGVFVQDLKDSVYANPWVVDGLVTDTKDLMQALPQVLGLGGSLELCAWTMHSERAPFPPVDLTTATADLVAIGGLFGQFGKGTPGVTAVGNPMSPPPVDTLLPSSVEGLFKGVDTLGPSSVRIFSVEPADGRGRRRWVVELPGTQDWSGVSGTNMFNLGNNVRMMAGQDTDTNEAVRQAMIDAGIQPGDPVMLAGFSQGGITAASLAANPVTRAKFNITAVVTAGSPIADFAIPSRVQVLSLEHSQDAVPRLDTKANPDRPNWVSVSRDPTGMTNKTAQVVNDTVMVHDGWLYGQTGALVDKSTDPSVVAVRDSVGSFFTGDPAQVGVQDFTLTRKVP